MKEKFFADFPKFMLTNIDKSSNIYMQDKYDLSAITKGGFKS